MGSRKARKIFFIILISLFLLLIHIFWVRKEMTDFGVFYQGGQRILEGETVYRISDGHLQYKYSPPSAIFFSLFTLFPYEVAKFIWYLSELFLLYLILSMSYEILPLKLKKKRVVIIFALLILAKFYAREIELGQVNILIIFTLVLMLKAFLRRNDVRGGLLWGFSLLFKPYALVFLPYFILKRRPKLVASGITAAILGLLLPVIFYGFEGNLIVLREWQSTLSKSTSSLLDVYGNASFYAFFSRILPEQKTEFTLPFVILVFIFLGLLFLRTMFSGKGLKRPEVLEFSFLIIMIPLFSPLGWYYNYLYSIMAVVILLNVVGEFPSILKYGLITNFVVIGGSLMEIMGKEAFRFYTGYSIVVINYLIILFYLFFARERKHDSPPILPV
jgi:hypothetical protein